MAVPGEEDQLCVSACHIHGFHLEGPYISPKYKGAQNENYIKAPNWAEFQRFQQVKMVTLAPELKGCCDFIRARTACGIVASIGHSDADYDETLCAIEAGASCLTHSFNCMQPLHQVH